MYFIVSLLGLEPRVTFIGYYHVTRIQAFQQKAPEQRLHADDVDLWWLFLIAALTTTD